MGNGGGFYVAPWWEDRCWKFLSFFTLGEEYLQGPGGGKDFCGGR